MIFLHLQRLKLTKENNNMKTKKIKIPIYKSSLEIVFFKDKDLKKFPKKYPKLLEQAKPLLC